MKKKEQIKGESEKIEDLKNRIKSLIKQKKTENEAFEKLLKALSENKSNKSNKNV